MKKGLIVLPLLALGMALPATDEVASYFAGSTVYVVYDADEGTFSDGLNMKSFSVRKGISWARLNAREKPSENPAPNDDQMLFEDWYYNGEKITDPSRFIINENIRVTANYVAGESSHNFQTDSWPVLAKVIADGGDDPVTYLHTNYGVSTLVGETKTIKLGDTEYTVRVIGEGQDYQDYDGTKATKDEQYTNPVALTFEFVNVLDKGFDIPFAYLSESSNKYLNSYLADVLNYDVYNAIEKSARRYIKPVYKCTNVGEGASGPAYSSAGKLEPVLSNMFSISLSELNADGYNDKFTAAHTDYDYVFPYDIEEESGRGKEAYTYYANADKPLEKTRKNETKTVPYWTRSPEVETPCFTWHISETGEIGDSDYDETIMVYNEQVPMDVIESISICPCFCY